MKNISRKLLKDAFFTLLGALVMGVLGYWGCLSINYIMHLLGLE